MDTLDAIDRSKGDDSAHLIDILKYWLKRADPSPTSKGLVDALKSSPVGESQLARDVEDELHSLANSCSFDKSVHPPQVPSRQYNFTFWTQVGVRCLLIFMLFLVPHYSDHMPATKPELSPGIETNIHHDRQVM